MRWKAQTLPGPWKRCFAVTPFKHNGEWVWLEFYWSRYHGMYYDATVHEVCLEDPRETPLNAEEIPGGNT